MYLYVAKLLYYSPLPPGLTEEMDNDGYHNIVNIDSSKVVIENMKETYKERTTISWQIMNCTAMDFKDGAFEAIVDKGTLDSILCGEGTGFLLSIYSLPSLFASILKNCVVKAEYFEPLSISEMDL